jgi:hypothetical protein
MDALLAILLLKQLLEKPVCTLTQMPTWQSILLQNFQQFCPPMHLCTRSMLLEYIRWCARFTTTIPSSPNHRLNPPSEHLNLDLRIPPEANPRLDSRTKSNASLPKDSATQKADQIVQILAKRYPSQILKLVATAVAPATLLQTCAPTTPAVHTN